MCTKKSAATLAADHFLFLFQIETDGVDTIAFTRIGWTVIKDMPEVRSTACAGDFGTHHTVCAVVMCLD
jgi:hypothetical protein